MRSESSGQVPHHRLPAVACKAECLLNRVLIHKFNLRVAAIEGLMARDHIRSRLLSRPQTYGRVQDTGYTKYDDSGQVFTETICPAGPMTPDWVWKTKGSSRQAGCFRSPGPGCSSLANMAVRSALQYSFDITAESLEGVPPEVASILWRSIVEA